jgi:ArsR family transcriptional regulator
MDQKVKAQYKVKAQIIKALAHPTRLLIVDELAKGERCVCELTKLVGDDVSTVSKHLTVLKSGGIVVDEKRGQQVFYTLRVPCVMKFFDCVASLMKKDSKA